MKKDRITGFDTLRGIGAPAGKIGALPGVSVKTAYSSVVSAQ